MTMRILARADRVSTVSRRQEEAVLGQLGFVGRLNRRTAGRRLTSVVPCGMDAGADAAGQAAPPAETAPCEKKGAGEFRICLGGSFNTWMDVATLASGLERAMARRSDIRVIVTGGATPGYSEGLYESFVERMKASGLEGRFEFHGWLANEAVDDVHRSCDVAINCDRWTVEGVFGSRNRIVQWLRLGVPVITSLLTEVSEDLAGAGGVIPFEIGSAESLADAILRTAGDPRGAAESLERGRAFVRREYNFERTVRDALEWAAAPEFAPDRAAGRAARKATAPFGAEAQPLNSLHELFLKL
jgi:glycosyltransferase involved in cell wall biosynthesis